MIKYPTPNHYPRLKHSILLGDMTEVPIPTRFMFLLLCPTTEQHTDHMEIGRAASTLFTDEVTSPDQLSYALLVCTMNMLLSLVKSINS